MAVVKKISELSPKGSDLGVTDLLIVGVSNGVDYDLKSVTGAQLIGTSVVQTITNGDTSHASSSDALFDALGLKVDTVVGSRLITSAESTILGNTSGTNTGDQDLSGYKLKSTGNNYKWCTTDENGFLQETTVVTGYAVISSPLGLPSISATTASELAYVSGVTSSIQTQINSKLNIASNLSDLTNTTTARTNLGLGSLATQSGTFSGTSSGTNTGDQTFLDARVQSISSSATVTPVSTNDLVIVTAQAVGLTLANPTGTFTEGQALMIRVKDNGTAQSIAFDTNYRAIGVTLPTTTVISKTMYLGIIYNSTDSKWDVIGYNIQA